MDANVGTLYVKIKADVDDLKSELSQIKGEVKQQESTFTSLGAVATGVLGSAIVAGAIKAGTEMFKLGASVEQAKTLFERLGGDSEGLDSLREATRGMVDDVSAMSAASKMMTMGLAENSQEAARLIEVSTQLGIAMGGDATDAVENFTLMLANQSIPRLDSFGISSGKVRARIQELTDTVPGMTRETAFMQATMEQAEVAMGRVGEQSTGTQGQMSKLAAETQNIKALFGEMVSGAVESTGMVGGLTVALQNFSKSITDMQARETPLKSLGESISETKDEFGRLSPFVKDIQSEMRALQREFGETDMTLEDYNAQLAELQAQLDGYSSSMEAATAYSKGMNEDWAAMREAIDGVPASLDTVVSGFGAFREVAGEGFGTAVVASIGAIQDAFNSDDFQGALTESLSTSASIMADFQSNFSSITEQGEAQRSEMQFNYNLQRAQAEQAFQAEYMALKQAGREEDAANLESAFQAEQDKTKAKYDVDGQLLERKLLLEKITQAKAHLTTLQMQGDKLRKSLMMQLQADQNFLQLEASTQKGILDTIVAGGSAQLQAEMEFAEQSRKISNELNQGKIRDAKTTVEAILELQNMNVAAAEAALANLEADLANFSVELPDIPMPDLDLGGGAGGGIGAGAARAEEAATKSLGTMVSDIEKGVVDAKSAMTELLGFEMPEGIDEGLAQFAEFTKLAVTSMFDTLMDDDLGIKDKVKKLGELMEPLQAVMGTFGKGLSATPLKADDTGNIAIFADQIVMMVTELDRAIGELETTLGTEDIDETLNELGANSNRLKEGLEVYSVDLTKAVPVKFGFKEKIEKFIDQVVQGIQIMHDKAKLIPATVKMQLASTAEMYKDAKDMFGILGVFEKLPDMSKVLEFRAASQGFFSAFDLTYAEIMDRLDGMTDEDREAEALAAETATMRKKIFEGVFFDFGGISAPSRVFRAQLKEVLDAVELATDESVPVFMRIKERWEESFETVTGTIDFVKGVFGGINDIAQSINSAVEVGGVDTNSALALFQQVSSIFDPINGLIVPTMPGTTAQDGGAPSWAGSQAGGGATLTVNFDGESISRAIDNMSESSRYSLANTLAEILYSMTGAAGGARA